MTAEYSRRSVGSIRVVNRGYDRRRGKWRQVEGVAKLIGDKSTGSLKVSFFWPFWAGYHVIALDEQNYGYAVVTSNKRSYLWILSRSPRLEDTVLKALVAQAAGWMFETKDLIYVEHDAPGN